MFGFGLLRRFTCEMTESRELLAGYAKMGSEAAFGELVKRYINLVYSTALRLVAHDTQEAEDVTQTVFIDLARLSRTLSSDTMLGGWLHQHTFHVASTAARSDRRRRAREREAVEMNMLHSEAGLNDATPLLDEAITQLPTEDRTAILLRFFEQRDFRSVGDALGTSEDAARMRVNRAVDKLHGLLKQRGVTISAAAFGTALATEAVTAAPAGLAGSVAGAALAGAAAGGGITATVVKFMTVSKIKFGIASAAVIACAAIPLLVEHLSQGKLRAENEALRQQVDETHRQQVEQLAQLATDNERLSNQLREAKSAQPLPDRRIAELLRLRGEVTRLRNENLKLSSNPVPDLGASKAERIFCANKLKQLGLSVRMWAMQHGDVTPSRLLEMPEATTPGILLCPSDRHAEAATNSTSSDQVYSSYLYLAPSLPDTERTDVLTNVLISCPIHGLVVYVDGSVHDSAELLRKVLPQPDDRH
jgi:RNA polymerase sigma factor (sigma-70 family)